MIKLTPVTKPAVPERIVNDVSLLCDWCGKNLDDDNVEPEDNNSVKITMEQGERYSSADYDGERIIFDLCCGCFTDKLVPLMTQNGCSGPREEWF